MKSTKLKERKRKEGLGGGGCGEEDRMKNRKDKRDGEKCLDKKKKEEGSEPSALAF